MSLLFGDVIAALTPLVEAFDRLGLPYYIGGSVASSVYGMPRRTRDVDIIAEIRIDQVRSLVHALEDKYYIDEDAVKDAIRHRSSYNVIFFDSMMKIDIFIPKRRLFSQEEIRRTQLHVLEDSSRPFNISSAEDAILTKLEWYAMGGGTSARQWSDILGMLKRQGTTLDLVYLDQWAVSLSVSDLLDRALREAGLR